MRRTTLALLLAFAPGALAAQAQEPSQPENRPAEERRAVAGFSAETRTQLEAMFQLARERDLPTEPLTQRIAEGQLKGASEAQILVATRRVHAELVASHEALIRAGREEPSDAEITRGAQLIARGASGAQLEAVIRNAPEGRLEVAFAVLSELTARGLPVDRAIAVVGANLSGTTTTAAGASGGSVGVQAGGSTGVSGGTPSLGTSAVGSLTGKLGLGLGRKP